MEIVEELGSAIDASFNQLKQSTVIIILLSLWLRLVAVVDGTCAVLGSAVARRLLGKIFQQPVCR